MVLMRVRMCDVRLRHDGGGAGGRAFQKPAPPDRTLFDLRHLDLPHAASACGRPRPQDHRLENYPESQLHHAWLIRETRVLNRLSITRVAFRERIGAVVGVVEEVE